MQFERLWVASIDLPCVNYFSSIKLENGINLLMDSEPVNFENAIKDIDKDTLQSSTEFENGPKIDPLKIISIYNSDEWEGFIDEWVHSLSSEYIEVVRPTGSGDKGIDVAGFADSNRLKGVWDNYQCKHYVRPLNFSNISSEIGKILWFSFSNVYKPPRICRFIAPKGASPSLTLLLGNAENLKNKVIEV